MTTQAELEAQIEANPDDVEAYHVYADWLQAQGDPRGELVALQAASHRDPDDKKLRQRATKLLAKHEDTFVGVLRDQMELTWRHGFVRDARLWVGPAELRTGLCALIDHPSGRFLQSLTFTNHLDVDAIVDVLLEARRPTTLAELRVTGLEERHVERLRSSFPRMNRSLDVEWRTVLDDIAAQRKLEARFDLKRLPTLDPSDGVVRELPIDRIVMGLRMELDKSRHFGLVQVMKRTFTAESLDRFAMALTRQHVDSSGGVTTRWAWRTIAAFGGRHAATWIGESVLGWQMRALHAIDVLAEIRSENAVLELAAIASDPRYEHEHRTHAESRLRWVALERRLDVEDLLDRSIPVDLGARGREVVLRRLCAQMIDGRRITTSTFRHHVANHSAIAPLAARIVWAVYAGDEVRTMFRLDDDGTAVDVDETPVQLDGMIGIVHPAELPAQERAALRERWRAAFETHAIAPLFPQLERTVHTTGIERFANCRAGIDQLRAVLEHQRGWAKQYAYEASGWRRTFVRDNAVAAVRYEGGAITDVVIADAQTSAPRPLERLHPVTVSELVDDLETATADKPAPTMASDGPIEKGTRVQIVRGRDRGKHGLVFWLEGSRCGVRGDDGDTYWADLAMVIVEGAAEPAESELWFDKGARVSWRKGRDTGTGTVFWMGKNKFGDGMRVGIKNDGDGETVWANAKDCALDEESERTPV